MLQGSELEVAAIHAADSVVEGSSLGAEHSERRTEASSPCSCSYGLEAKTTLTSSLSESQLKLPRTHVTNPVQALRGNLERVTHAGRKRGVLDTKVGGREMDNGRGGRKVAAHPSAGKPTPCHPVHSSGFP